jgi:Ca2+-binding EF-hand superfamily protein
LEIVRLHDSDGDGRISKDEFFNIMKDKMLDELVKGDDELEDLRAKFKEADTDYSGFLSVDEFYGCLLRMGADVSRREVIELFMEFDKDQNMEIDIDEFIELMSVGD